MEFFIDLLAAVPSVIYGLLGVFIVVPLMREYIQPALKNLSVSFRFFTGPAYGVGFLTAGIVLAIMVIPYIISVSREVLLSVPRDQREAALALGSTRWESTWKVVVPFARTGIMGSIFLALARALGETMAVTMVIGNAPHDQPLRSFLPATPSPPSSPTNSPKPPAICIPNRSIELGLGALSSDLHSQRPRPPPDRRHLAARQRNGARMNARLRWRKFVSNFMLTMTGVCALVAVSVLFLHSWLSGLSRRHLHQLELLHQAARARRRNRRRHGQRHRRQRQASLARHADRRAHRFLRRDLPRGIQRRKIAFVVRYAADLLNGVPSIVIGIFAYSLAVHPFKHFSTLAGGFALGVMMIPITLRSTEEFLLGVPRTLREGAMALGASKWKTIATVIVPAAYRGILTAILLAFARVAGETAPLLFTAFGNRYWSHGWNQPTASLPVMIYTYAISPYEDWHRQAWAAGLVLLALILDH